MDRGKRVKLIESKKTKRTKKKKNTATKAFRTFIDDNIQSSVIVSLGYIFFIHMNATFVFVSHWAWAKRDLDRKPTQISRRISEKAFETELFF